MARPRKYHTPEERLAANRAKSKRHYEGNKWKINYKRKQHRTANTSLFQALQEEATSGRVRGSGGVDNPLSSCMARAEALRGRFIQRIKGDAPLYVEEIYGNYIVSGDNDIILDAITKNSTTLTSMRACENEVLQLVGVGNEWQSVQAWGTRISQLIRCLEEILCLAMVDRHELEALHSKTRLMYQCQ